MHQFSRVSIRAAVSLRLLPAAVLFFLSESPSLATSIVAARTTEEVTIAADSKITSSSVGHALASDAVCKIHRAADLFFGVAGLTAIAPTNYDAISIVSEALKNEKKTDNALQVAGENIRTALLRWLPQVLSQNPQIRTSVYETNQAVSIVAVAIVDDTPTQWQIAVDFSKIKDGEVKSEKRNAGYGAFIIGENNALIRTIRNQEYPRSGSTRFIATSLVQFAINHAPDKVGPPIAFVTLRKPATGAASYEQSPSCP